MGKLITVADDTQRVPAYLAEPSVKPKGAVIVIHEVWGLVDHIRSVADRFAAEGYVALAPDLLSDTDIAERARPFRIDLFNPAKRNEVQPKLREVMTPMREPDFGEKTLAKLQACFDYLYTLTGVGRRVAVCGFCFGGTYAYSLAMRESRLCAVVPFYGHVVTDPVQLRAISSPILAFYGEQDENLIATLAEVRTAMHQAGVTYAAVVYPDCGHAFFNDSNSYAYNGAAAKDAWRRTLAFLAAYVK